VENWSRVGSGTLWIPAKEQEQYRPCEAGLFLPLSVKSTFESYLETVAKPPGAQNWQIDLNV